MFVIKSIVHAIFAISILLIVSSCSRAESDHTVPLITFTPTISATPPISTVSPLEEPPPIALPLKLELFRTETTDGFKIDYKETDSHRIRVSQTLISPKINGMSYGVHVVSYSAYIDQTSVLQKNAVVVNPRTGDFMSFPLYSFTYKGDAPETDFAEGYGFVEDRYFVYLALRREESIDRYEVMKMDILTGEQAVIADDSAIGELIRGFGGHAHNWMNRNGDSLILNSFNEGYLVHVDLKTGQATLRGDGIRHSWPYYLTTISPDGERFWHTSYDARSFKLYSKEGRELASVPFGDNRQLHLMLWSRGGQFAYLEYVSDKNEPVEMQAHTELSEYAKEKIFIYDEIGRQQGVLSDPKKDRYVEIAGWVTDIDGLEYALVHNYSWQPNENGEAEPDGKLGRKTNPAFRLYDPRNNTYKKLIVAKEREMLRHSQAAMGGVYGPLYAVDMELGYVIEWSREGSWVDTGNPDELVWVINDWNTGEEHTFVSHKQLVDGSSPFEAVDLRSYKATEGKRLSRNEMSYVTIK